MATAATIAFELVNRSWDVFGFADDEGNEAIGALWDGYRPGHSMTLVLSKNPDSDAPIVKTIPLIDVDVDGTVVQLYPELFFGRGYILDVSWPCFLFWRCWRAPFCGRGWC